jgi:hypothetical protein
MASQALPVRAARLGRGAGADPAAGVRAAVLLLPAARPTSTRRAPAWGAAAFRPLVRRLTRVGAAQGLVTHVVRYRFRGWNGTDEHPVRDAEWATDEIVRRYGDVPVCLVGIGAGARAALRAAGHPAVGSVVALAPWLPIGRRPEPVKHLIGRHVLIAHGTDDARCDPDLSFRFAERAKKINPDVCRFEVHTDGHSMRHHRREVLALTTDFALGTLLDRPFSRPLTDALAAPPPLGLRMPLALGYGTG